MTRMLMPILIVMLSITALFASATPAHAKWGWGAKTTRSTAKRSVDSGRAKRKVVGIALGTGGIAVWLHGLSRGDMAEIGTGLSAILLAGPFLK